MQRQLFSLIAFACLALLIGCNRNSEIDGKAFNAADWEKQIKVVNLSEEDFTRLYALRVAAEIQGAKVRITGVRELSVRLADGTELKAFLDNAWIEAAKDAEKRPEIVNRYLAALIGPASDIASSDSLTDTNNIVAVIRDIRFATELEKHGSRGTNGIVSEFLVADLKVLYAVDGDGLIHYLTEGDRLKLGLSLPALRTLAMSNLKRLLPEVSRRGNSPAFMIVADGNYESSLLLADGLWEDQAKSVEGDIVAAVPSRDMLIFTGANSKEGIEALRRIIAKVEKNDSHLISNTLLVRRNSSWEKFTD